MTSSPARRSWAFRLTLLALAAASLGAFSVIVIAAGHGIGTTGMILATGFETAWLPVQLPVYAATTLFVLSTFTARSPLHAGLFLTGVGSMALAWLALLLMSPNILTLATSLPFLACTSGMTFLLLRSGGIRAARDRKGFEVAPVKSTPPVVAPPPAVPSSHARRHP